MIAPQIAAGLAEVRLASVSGSEDRRVANRTANQTVSAKQTILAGQLVSKGKLRGDLRVAEDGNYAVHFVAKRLSTRLRLSRFCRHGFGIERLNAEPMNTPTDHL